jgi:hypothetical protein
MGLGYGSDEDVPPVPIANAGPLVVTEKLSAADVQSNKVRGRPSGAPSKS